MSWSLAWPFLLFQVLPVLSLFIFCPSIYYSLEITWIMLLNFLLYIHVCTSYIWTRGRRSTTYHIDIIEILQAIHLTWACHEFRSPLCEFGNVKLVHAAISSTLKIPLHPLHGRGPVGGNYWRSHDCCLMGIAYTWAWATQYWIWLRAIWRGPAWNIRLANVWN